jgi:hypothetical protein
MKVDFTHYTASAILEDFVLQSVRFLRGTSALSSRSERSGCNVSPMISRPLPDDSCKIQSVAIKGAAAFPLHTSGNVQIHGERLYFNAQSKKNVEKIN